MGEVSEEVIRELLSHVSYSYLAEELRAHGSSPHVWSQLLEEAAAAGARMFLEDGAGPGPRQITMSTSR